MAHGLYAAWRRRHVGNAPDDQIAKEWALPDDDEWWQILERQFAGKGVWRNKAIALLDSFEAEAAEVAES